MNMVTSPKLLCISRDERLTGLLDKAEVLQQGSEVCHVSHLEDGLSELDRGAFDAVLLDSQAAQDDPAAVARVHRACDKTPLMVADQGNDLLADLDADVSVVAKEDLNEQRLALEVLRMLASRGSQLQQAMRGNLDRLLEGTPASKLTAPPQCDEFSKLAACNVDARLIAVRRGLPSDPRHVRITGATDDQLLMQWTAPAAFQTELYVVGAKQHGVECFEYYQSVERRNDTVRLRRLGLDRLFPVADRTPRLQGHYVRVGLAADAVHAWEGLGVLRPEPVDRILVCPQCGAVPSLRPGCRSCGSPQVESQPMIHHFACAYVAPAEEFEMGDQLRCPKCLASQLVIGADCEHLPGQAQCRQCDWKDTQRELYGRCFECTKVFPASAAIEQEVIRYDVDRLEPLGLLATS